MAKIKIYDDGNHLTGVAQTVPIYRYAVDCKGERPGFVNFDESIAKDIASKIKSGALVLMDFLNIGENGTDYMCLTPYAMFQNGEFMSLDVHNFYAGEDWVLYEE